MPQNKIVVEGPVDYEDTIDGGNFLYDVSSCDIDPEKGTLTWDRIVFPTVPVPAGYDVTEITPQISRADPIINHVRTMSRVGDDVLELLRSRGVEVIVIDNPSPAVTCGD